MRIQMFVCRAGRGLGPSGDLANVVGIAPPADGAHETWVEVTRLQAGLCGGSRPHFFRGVATVLHALALDLCVADICGFSRTIVSRTSIAAGDACLGGAPFTSGRHTQRMHEWLK